MKAIVFHQYGSPDVLKCEEIPKPVPADDEVLIRVSAAAVNPIDRFYRGRPYLIRIMTGLSKPKEKRLGFDVAGRVEAVGRNVTQLKPGDEVFGSCRGAFAEYACGPETSLTLKPDNVTFEQSAAAPAATLTALQGLRDQGRIQPGQKVLINGAAGGVGTFAAQIAKSFGAEVTGVCSTRNLEMVRSIGADHVIDYTREDFTKGTERYDLIFDCISNHSLSACKRVLNSNGRVVTVGAPKLRTTLKRAIIGLVWSRLFGQQFVVQITKGNHDDLTFVRDLLQLGKVTPVIDRCYRLSETPDALRHLEQGHARGKIVITVEPA